MLSNKISPSSPSTGASMTLDIATEMNGLPVIVGLLRRAWIKIDKFYLALSASAENPNVYLGLDVTLGVMTRRVKGGTDNGRDMNFCMHASAGLGHERLGGYRKIPRASARGASSLIYKPLLVAYF
ncbi:MAG: hypothetical protein WC621_04515 [Patescibacteria group bacterium]